MARRLEAPAGGFFNAADAPDLLFRGKEVFDGALPAANPVAALGLLDLARRTGEPRFAETAERSLRAFAPLAQRHPDGARALAVALARCEALAKSAEADLLARPARPRDENLAATAVAALDREASAAVEARLDLGAAAPDGWRELTLHLQVRPGWRLSSPSGPAAAAALRIDAIAAEVDGLAIPDALPSSPGEAHGLAGHLELRGRVRAVPSSRAPAIALRFRPCAGDRCLPEQRLELPLPG